MTRNNLRLSLWLIVVAVTFYTVTWPLVVNNSRYFYHEDDAHHFNHTVEMARDGRLNPHYFNKPALHFYLRMPIVYASATWEKAAGRLSSLRDVRTRNSFGVGGYAFTPSHPNILLWNRLESVLWGAGIGILVFLLTLHLTAQIPSAILATTITFASPEFLKNSYIIGVDTLMALLCLSCTALALADVPSRLRSRLSLAALLAGLACSAKYNAAPVAVVPLTLWATQDRTIKSLLAVTLAGFGGFLLGAPFSLLEFREFWSGISYELWHYAVAGHAEHSSEPGLQQARFYLRWITTDGVGWLATGFAAVGCVAFLKRDRSRAIIFSAFPLAYCSLMIMQRANFTRNMVVIIPYFAIYAAYAFSCLSSPARRSLLDATLRALMATCILSLPCARSAVVIRDALYRGDSRDALFAWFHNVRQPDEDVAVAGQLQISWELLSLPGVDSFDLSKTSLETLRMRGYRHVIIPSSDASALPASYDIEWRTAGEERRQRFPDNPAITIARPVPAVAPESVSTLQLAHVGEKLAALCAASAEEHCWIQSIVTRANIPSSTRPTTLEVMSPWKRQRLRISTLSGDEILSTPLDQPGVWTTVPVPPLAGDGANAEVFIHISEIHSLASQGAGNDTRRLGIAIHR